jgi:hypothetical protein
MVFWGLAIPKTAHQAWRTKPPPPQISIDPSAASLLQEQPLWMN